MSVAETAAVPLAIINHRCWMGELPKKALEQLGRRYEIAFECSGLSGLKAAIRAGFAVGILLESNVEKDMKILSVNDGFPILPTTRRSIICHDDAPMELAQAMAGSIKQAV